MQREIIVVDDFYNDPDAVREAALGEEFTVSGNYPGRRTGSHATEALRRIFEGLISGDIGWWGNDDASYNGSFQYTTQEMDSWVHRDNTDWAGIVFLSPNAPLTGGTAFLRHLPTGLSRLPKATQVLEDGRLVPELKATMDRHSNDLSKWAVIDYVGNVYNRLVLFRGDRSHRSMQYFGTDLETGRLTQVFFFNEKK